MSDARLQTFRLALTLRAPVLSQAVSGQAFGIDVQPARKDGRVMVPGTLVKGKIRQAWRELKALSAEAFEPSLDDWLGPITEEEDRPRVLEVRRGRLHFHDLLASTAEVGTTRYRIQIDDTFGSVVQGALGAIETPWAAGQAVDFEGEISCIASDAEAQAVQRWLASALRWIDGLGSSLGIGFGRLLAAEVELAPSRPLWSACDQRLEGTRFDVRLTQRDPLLVATRPTQGNISTGGPVIPGATLKGALASTLREALGHPSAGAVTAELAAGSRFAELASHFAAIRFSHAFYAPKDTGRRPLMPPCSLVEADQQVFDVARLDGPHLFATTVHPKGKAPEVQWRAPNFAPDWKTSKVRQQLGWASISTETRVHTAIDGDLRRGAEGKLFVYQSVAPNEDKAYFGHLDLSRVPASARQAVAEQLQGLLRGDGDNAGLRNVGKTKSNLEVDLKPAGTFPSRIPKRQVDDGQPWVVVLQTPALLLDATGFDESTRRAELHEAYQDVWRQLAGDVTLLRHFTHERLVGGQYFWRKFCAGSSYHPDVLTGEGSVFVFKAPSAAARKFFETSETEGLPLPPWLVERLGSADPSEFWRRCPFVPENGYGEIVLNPELPQPAAEQVLRVREVKA